MPTDDDLSSRLTKILHRLPSDPSASEVLKRQLDAAGRSITDLRVTIGDADELDRLRRENASIRDTAPKTWDEFLEAARVKGYRKIRDIATRVGVDVGYLNTCKRVNRVPFAVVQKIAAVEVDDDGGSADEDPQLRRARARCQILEEAFADPEFLAFRMRHADLAAPPGSEQAQKEPRSDMGPAEFAEALDVLFPWAAPSARSKRLAAMTGYDETSHRAHAAKYRRDGEPHHQAPAESLGRYVRELVRRERARTAVAAPGMGDAGGGEAAPSPVPAPERAVAEVAAAAAARAVGRRGPGRPRREAVGASCAA